MRVWKRSGILAAMLASMLATVVVPSAAAACSPGLVGTAFPYCPGALQAPADGTSMITLTFDASTISDATILNINVTGATFVGGAGTFAPSGSLTYPRTSVFLSGSPVTVAAGSELSLASTTVGTATVMVAYSNNAGTTVYDSVESFTFTTPPPPIITPTTKADCQHGGWASFTDAQGTPFTSQSACTKWVKANT